MEAAGEGSGFLLKHHPEFIRWTGASLREAGHDSEGYYLKVDGLNEENKETEQIYLFLTPDDVAIAVSQWIALIKKEGSEWARFCLKNHLKEEGL